MMRCRAGLHTDKARRHLRKESQHIAPFQFAANDHLAISINAMHLKNRLRNIETDCLNCLHDWLLSIVGTSTAPTFMALTCRWRSRPQHQKRTSLWQQLVRKIFHAAGHCCLDRGEIAPGRAWLGRDYLGPNNEEGRDHDEDNGQLLAHCSLVPL